jgi:hypothetical protein
LFTVAAKRHGVWERGFVDVKQTMEDMVTKISDRLDAMNTEFKDSFREVMGNLKAQDDKIEFLRQKSELLETSMQSIRADTTTRKGVYHMAPTSPSELVDKGDDILPCPPPTVLPRLNIPSFATCKQAKEADAEVHCGGERRGWVPKMDFPKFNGSRPSVWNDQCLSLFHLYQVAEQL